jgi:hypothetical protein
LRSWQRKVFTTDENLDESPLAEMLHQKRARSRSKETREEELPAKSGPIRRSLTSLIPRGRDQAAGRCGCI